MQVTVNIEDTKLNNLVAQGLESLPKEDIGILAKEAIKKALENTDIARSLVFRNHYGDMQLREWIVEGIRNQISEQDISEYKNTLLEVVKKEGHKLIIAAICNVITNNLFSFENRDTFQKQMVDALRNKLPPTY